MLSNWKRIATAGLLFAAVTMAAGQQRVGGTGNSPVRDRNHTQQQSIPEGGTAPTYLLLSGAVMLGAVLLTHRRRSTTELPSKA